MCLSFCSTADCPAPVPRRRCVSVLGVRFNNIWMLSASTHKIFHCHHVSGTRARLGLLDNDTYNSSSGNQIDSTPNAAWLMSPCSIEEDSETKKQIEMTDRLTVLANYYKTLASEGPETLAACGAVFNVHFSGIHKNGTGHFAFKILRISAEYENRTSAPVPGCMPAVQLTIVAFLALRHAP